MKHFPKLDWLAIALISTSVGHTALALEGPKEFVHSLSHGLLLHGSQGYLGVDLKNITPDRAATLKLKDAHGAEVITVDHDAPAAKAGFRIHDVILQMNGQRIDGCDQLRRLLRKQPPGHTVSFVVNRDGSQINVSVQLANRALLEQEAWSQHFSVPEPEQSPSANQGESFLATDSHGGSSFLGTLIPNSLYVGADVNPVHTQLAAYFGVTSGTGLLVENVDSQSPAWHAGLQAGDVILMVNASPMISRNDWLKAIHYNRGKLVQVTIMRNKQEQTLTMLAGHRKKPG